MSLHIKTIETTYEGARLFATLSLVKGRAVGVSVRLTRAKGGGRETMLGTAELNTAGEIVNYGSALNDSERNALEKVIAEAVA